MFCICSTAKSLYCHPSATNPVREFTWYISTLYLQAGLTVILAHTLEEHLARSPEVCVHHSLLLHLELACLAITSLTRPQSLWQSNLQPLMHSQNPHPRSNCTWRVCSGGIQAVGTLQRTAYLKDNAWFVFITKAGYSSRHIRPLLTASVFLCFPQ